MSKLDWASIDALITRALDEDIGGGDVTTGAIFDHGERVSAVLTAHQACVIAGMEVAARVFRRLDPDVELDNAIEDGALVEAGDTILHVEGQAQALLEAERTALNFLQHLSGIATLTREYVDAIAGTEATLLDTRKTIPGYRALAKYATHVGGATNHRMGLYDAILIKDNHIAAAGDIAEAVKRARKADLPVEVECDDLDQVKAALKAGADRLLLDNMEISMLKRAVKLVAGKVPLEASGKVSLNNIRAIAKTGVDFISVGAITHSAPAVDIGMDFSIF